MERKREVKVIDNIIHKKCSTCENFKKLDQFKLSANLNYVAGLEDACIECRKEYNRNRYLENPELFRNSNLKTRFGFSIEEYKEMYKSQEGKCLICKEIFEILAVDHCHETEKVRGLLCRNCNIGLGGFKDNIEFLKSAIEYLNKFKEIAA